MLWWKKAVAGIFMVSYLTATITPTTALALKMKPGTEEMPVEEETVRIEEESSRQENEFAQEKQVINKEPEQRVVARAKSQDVALLAQAIHGEARGESYTGQVAVGAVILNRVNSGKFPDSIPGVVYQPLAFTAVADGQINLSPDKQAWKAAQAALAGWDPSDGALYYYNPQKSTSKWIWSRPVVKRIGKHLFAY